MSVKISFATSAADVSAYRSFLGHKDSGAIVDKGIAEGLTLSQIGDNLVLFKTGRDPATLRSDGGRGGRNETHKGQCARAVQHIRHLEKAPIHSAVRILKSAGNKLASRLSFDSATLAIAEKLGEYVPNK
jgi:hypothetical protein